MFLIDCPNCGPRSVTEFRFGGEQNPRPRDAASREWADYVYTRKNGLGVQQEWWYHRMGCRRWFLARRHTMTNEVLETFWPGEQTTADDPSLNQDQNRSMMFGDET